MYGKCSDQREIKLVDDFFVMWDEHKEDIQKPT